jgi:tetratricopeptide (TPR) repeat protein
MRFLAVLCAVLALQPPFAVASTDVAAEVAALTHEWDVIKYQTAAADQEAALKNLSEKSHTASEKYPRDAEPLVWEGIILSTYAGAKGGLGALSLVKQARRCFEAAERIDPNALGGALYTSLGSLYYQVPGWPIGFGDNEKARAYLEKGLKANPNDIDANYFYGDFLSHIGEYAKADAFLNRALSAPARPGRDLADAGRRKEVAGLLKEVRRHL